MASYQPRRCHRTTHALDRWPAAGLEPSVSTTPTFEDESAIQFSADSAQPGSLWATPELSSILADSVFTATIKPTDATLSSPDLLNGMSDPSSQTSPTLWPTSTVTVTVTTTAAAAVTVPEGRPTSGIQCSCIYEPTRTPPLTQEGPSMLSTVLSASPRPQSVSPSSTQTGAGFGSRDPLGDFDSEHGGLHWPGDHHTWQF